MAKYQTRGDKRQSFIGLGSTILTQHADPRVKYQVHFRAGFDQRIFKYVHGQAEIKLTSGENLNGMYNLSQNKLNRLDFSGGINLRNKLDVNIKAKKPNGVNVKTSVEVEHTIGSSNWGALTGTLSELKPSDAVDILKNLNLHLNQANLDISADKKVSNQASVIVQAHYQGSNIGQGLRLIAGSDIKIPNGAELLIFSGYSKNDIGGFKTKHSLLAAPSGAEAGLRYTTKNGTQFEASGRGLTHKPYVNGTIKLPLYKKKK